MRDYIEFRVWGLGNWGQSVGFKVCRIWGLGPRVQGLGLRPQTQTQQT